MAGSQKQTVANRRNAQKSTGPKTMEGKQKASMNAVKHGLRTKHPVIDSPHLKEDHSEYHELIYTIYQDLDPEGIFEEYLVRQIANALWRSQRVIRCELDTIHYQLDKVDRKVEDLIETHSYFSDDYQATPEEEERLREQTSHRLSVPDSEQSNSLSLYEARLARKITRFYNLLSHLQKRRKSEETKEKIGSLSPRDQGWTIPSSPEFSISLSNSE